MMMVASSYDESLAYDGAQARAEEACFRMGKDYVVLKEASKYRGADRTTAGVVNVVGG